VYASQDKINAKIEKIVRKHIKPNEPGAAICVIKNKKLLYKNAFGLADVETKKTLQTDMIFDLASCSKQFTAMAILILADKGMISLEDDITKYIPEITTYDKTRPIRVIDLVYMVSGLGDLFHVTDTEPDYWRGGMSNDSVALLVGDTNLQFPTGEKYIYSNTDYCLLGLIVTRVSKKSFGAFLKSEIFDVIGMKNTIVFERMEQIIPNRVFGWRRQTEDSTWIRDVRNYPIIYGASNIFSTIDDLARWHQSLQAAKLVSATSHKLAFESGKLDSGDTTGYGFGWAVEPDGNIVWHTGMWAGTSTYICRYLKEGLAVIILSNISNFDADRLGDEILYLFL